MEQYRKKGLINLVSFLFHSYSLGAKHHEHEDIRLGGASDIADDPSSTSSAKDSIDPPSSIQQQPTANNVLPKDYQNEERIKVQQSIMDQTNSIVGLFNNMQDNPNGGRHQKSPEMAFLKQASQMTGTGPWTVTKGKLNYINNNLRIRKTRRNKIGMVARDQKRTMNGAELDTGLSNTYANIN